MNKYIQFIVLTLFLFGCQMKEGAHEDAPVLDLSYNRSLFQYHQYHKTDTLNSIANAYDVEVAQIMDANHLQRGQSIKEGRVLKIPLLAMNSDVKPKASHDKRKPMLLKGWQKPVRITHKTTEDPHGGWMIHPKVTANVRAVAAGRVVFVGRRNKGLGLQVIVQHGQNQSTMYALIADAKVKKGQMVKTGQLIGLSSLSRQMRPIMYFDRIKT